METSIPWISYGTDVVYDFSVLRDILLTDDVNVYVRWIISRPEMMSLHFASLYSIKIRIVIKL